MVAWALMCSGQGGQGPDLIQSLLAHPEAKALYDRARDALPKAAKDWLAAPDPETLFADAVSQPLITLHQLMAWEVVRPTAPDPDVFLGFSLGELVAHACAGAWSPETAITLAGERAACMDKAASADPSGLVAATGLGPDAIQNLCAKHGAYVAIVEGPEHFTIGARRADLEPLAQAMRDAGAAQAVVLRVPLASHTPFLAQATETFRPALSAQDYAPTQGTILAGTSGEPVYSKTDAVKALSDQISHTLRFDRVLDQAVSRGCRVFLELGPGKTLAHTVLANHPDVEARSLDEFADPTQTGRWLESALRRQE